jgi:hypothetical protein
VHEAFDLSGSVAVAHLASLQAEQVVAFLGIYILYISQGFFSQLCAQTLKVFSDFFLQVELRAKIKSYDDVKHVLDHKAEAAANRSRPDLCI